MPVPSEMQPFGSALPGQAKGTVYQIAEVARNLRTKSPQRCALPPSMIAHSHLLRFPWAGALPAKAEPRPTRCRRIEVLSVTLAFARLRESQIFCDSEGTPLPIGAFSACGTGLSPHPHPLKVSVLS